MAILSKAASKPIHQFSKFDLFYYILIIFYLMIDKRFSIIGEMEDTFYEQSQNLKR